MNILKEVLIKNLAQRFSNQFYNNHFYLEMDFEEAITHLKKDVRSGTATIEDIWRQLRDLLDWVSLDYTLPLWKYVERLQRLPTEITSPEYLFAVRYYYSQLLYYLRTAEREFVSKERAIQHNQFLLGNIDIETLRKREAVYHTIFSAPEVRPDQHKLFALPTPSPFNFSHKEITKETKTSSIVDYHLVPIAFCLLVLGQLPMTLASPDIEKAKEENSEEPPSFLDFAKVAYTTIEDLGKELKSIPTENENQLNKDPYYYIEPLRTLFNEIKDAEHAESLAMILSLFPSEQEEPFECERLLLFAYPSTKNPRTALILGQILVETIENIASSPHYVSSIKARAHQADPEQALQYLRLGHSDEVSIKAIFDIVLTSQTLYIPYEDTQFFFAEYKKYWPNDIAVHIEGNTLLVSHDELKTVNDNTPISPALLKRLAKDIDIIENVTNRNRAKQISHILNRYKHITTADIHSMYYIATFYFTGSFFNQDLQLAMAWAQEASSRGSIRGAALYGFFIWKEQPEAATRLFEHGLKLNCPFTYNMASTVTFTKQTLNISLHYISEYFKRIVDLEQYYFQHTTHMMLDKLEIILKLKPTYKQQVLDLLFQINNRSEQARILYSKYHPSKPKSQPETKNPSWWYLGGVAVIGAILASGYSIYHSFKKKPIDTLAINQRGRRKKPTTRTFVPYQPKADDNKPALTTTENVRPEEKILMRITEIESKLTALTQAENDQKLLAKKKVIENLLKDCQEGRKGINLHSLYSKAENEIKKFISDNELLFANLNKNLDSIRRIKFYFILKYMRNENCVTETDSKLAALEKEVQTNTSTQEKIIKYLTDALPENALQRLRHGLKNYYGAEKAHIIWENACLPPASAPSSASLNTEKAPDLGTHSEQPEPKNIAPVEEPLQQEQSVSAPSSPNNQLPSEALILAKLQQVPTEIILPKKSIPPPLSTRSSTLFDDIYNSYCRSIMDTIQRYHDKKITLKIITYILHYSLIRMVIMLNEAEKQMSGSTSETMETFRNLLVHHFQPIYHYKKTNKLLPFCSFFCNLDTPGTFSGTAVSTSSLYKKLDKTKKPATENIVKDFCHEIKTLRAMRKKISITDDKTILAELTPDNAAVMKIALMKLGEYSKCFIESRPDIFSVPDKRQRNKYFHNDLALISLLFRLKSEMRNLIAHSTIANDVNERNIIDLANTAIGYKRKDIVHFFDKASKYIYNKEEERTEGNMLHPDKLPEDNTSSIDSADCKSF